ncbi:CaiB/BaiF CoA transferase family protein [Shumkonia mesophila]|uniref:CaiB/BaiF CoA transferase family protein n=1 Tax=Shumkonia mesophila TaxID=2838854 RepID=UPI0029345A2D|nr:CoA transferase [Shumkonia mesophila]
MTGCLHGLKVLDISRFIAGPTCAMHLGDLGADVVKVERKAGEETRANLPQLGDQSLYFLTLNRNKRDITLDFRNPADQETLRRLIAKADVLIENFRAGTMEKMGCGWETLHALNPRLIMVRISGFGQDGPLSARPCFDAIAQAMGGVMSLTGQSDGPPTLAGVYVADFATALFATVGTLAALNKRHETGEGQLVEATLLESVISMLMTAIPQQAQLGTSMGRMGNTDRYVAPVNCFQASDGSWVYVQGGTDALFPRLAETLEMPELLEDPRFSTVYLRLDNADVLEGIVAAWVKERTAETVVELMDKAGVPCAKVATMADIIANPQLRARGQLVEIDHPSAGKYLTNGVPVRLSDTPASIRRPPPLLDEHRAEILREWLKEESQLAVRGEHCQTKRAGSGG